MIPKLFQWLIVLSVFISVWVAIVFDYVAVEFSKSNKQTIVLFPFYLLVVFACYSLAVIGYRVATFNDCKEASEELKKQILEAKEDLKSRGFKFD
ncbi:hypothetical protein CHS0354_030277 [Potamilus streckersoni]|uniref:Dolichol-phosphate mannosyltransferase subunit 3 n=1 Tax=Potamilus streckersoni TaxID=2493646 RepID=A0AAE0RV10_9BIVA|nr:hypothetical protein CHS0354_030277 [Potamilus streckersoni]